MSISFGDLSTPAGLKELDEYLLTRSYISGFQASRDDLTVYSALKSFPKGYTNAARWFTHIKALLGANFAGTGVGVVIGGAAPAVAAPTAAVATPPAAEAKPAEDEEDDDDLDLFGEATEEEKAAAAEREAKAAASGKKKESGKSSVLLDVKPWDDETDMAKMEAAVRKVQMDGLLWGASKLVPVGRARRRSSFRAATLWPSTRSKEQVGYCVVTGRRHALIATKIVQPRAVRFFVRASSWGEQQKSSPTATQMRRHRAVYSSSSN
ncbi:unnamed protein product [Closterium sp. Naga37s-1]|nr:unnamed protein product [Closterium sp. Naga37s-1]